MSDVHTSARTALDVPGYDATLPLERPVARWRVRCENLARELNDTKQELTARTVELEQVGATRDHWYAEAQQNALALREVRLQLAEVKRERDGLLDERPELLERCGEVPADAPTFIPCTSCGTDLLKADGCVKDGDEHLCLPCAGEAGPDLWDAIR